MGTEMNVYSKLQKVRVDLAAIPMKKSGLNKFQGYSYYELSDFMPIAQKLFLDQRLCSVLDFGDKEKAALHIVDCDKPESVISFCSPVADATVKGASPIQIVGSAQSYLTRYLWLQALQLTEHDTVDAQPPTDRDTPKKTPTDYAETLKSAKTAQELASAWQKVPTHVKPDHAALKDVLKAKLTPKTSDTTDWPNLITNADSMESLTAIYKSMSPEQQQQYNVDVDFRSSELQGG